MGRALRSSTLRSIAAYTIYAGIALLAACSDDKSTSPADTPSRAVAIAGQDSYITVGGSVDSVAIVVFGTSGEPLPNATVTWTASSGTLSSASSVTDEQGIARTVFTSGTTSGIVTFTAGIEGISPLTFTATLVPGAPAQLVALSSATDTITAGQSLSFAAVRVEDSYSNPVPNVTLMAVLQNASSDDGLVSPSLTSNSDGIVYQQFVAGAEPGTRLLRFSTPDGLLTVSYTFEVIAPPQSDSSR